MPSNKKKTILIVANGRRPAESLVRHVRKKADYIIAADGGLAHCHYYNLSPDCLIGDLDSYNPRQAVSLAEERIVRVPDQNRTDLQKALAYAGGLDPAGVMIIGALGGRADHNLANLIIFNNHNDSWPLTLYDDYGCFKLLDPGENRLADPPGTIISLFTFSGARGVRTRGLKYALQNETIDVSFTGLSNVVSEQPASVSLSDGRLLLYRQGKRLP